MGENIYKSMIDKGLISKLYKQLNIKTKRKRNTHFVLQGQNWTAETPEKKRHKIIQ